MKRFLAALTAIVPVAIFSGTANAYEEGTWYAQLDFGKPEVIIFSGSNLGSQPNNGGSGNPLRSEEKIQIIQGRIGNQVFENLGFEIFYADGRKDATFSDGANSGEVSVDRMYGINARAGVKAKEWLGLTATLGHTWADVSSTVPTIGSGDTTESGFSWGFGADFFISKNFAIAANFTSYIDEASGDDEQLRVAGLSLGVRLTLPSGDD